MTKAEFVEWKSHPITKQVFAHIHERVRDIQIELGFNAGTDPVQDARRSGAILALIDVLNADFDEESQ